MANYLRECVNKAVSVYDFVKEQKLTHRIVGDEIFIVCPFHKDRNPSCSVSTTKKIFRCFGCQITGDIVYLMAKIYKKSTDEVISLYSLKHGIKYPSKLEAVVKQKHDEFLEELVIRRDILFLKWIGFSNLLRKSRRLAYKSPVLSDESAFFYNIETWTDMAEYNLSMAERGLKLYCRTKGISVPKVSQC